MGAMPACGHLVAESGRHGHALSWCGGLPTRDDHHLNDLQAKSQIERSLDEACPWNRNQKPGIPHIGMSPGARKFGEQASFKTQC
jgi:hypothetical protein